MSAAKLAGVIGWPVQQSLSPRLHGHWLKLHGLAGAYMALPVVPENFGRVVSTLPQMGFAGANVTVPHKEAAFALCSELDEDAQATGAVNTLIFQGADVKGLNTDVRGFAASVVETFGTEAIKDKNVAILGAGGAARGIIIALWRMGAKQLFVSNRTLARTRALVSEFGGRIPIRPTEWGDWNRALELADMVVNTTSLGMTGKDPLDAHLINSAFENLPAHAMVADIVYNPLETALLREARARGHRVMDGLGMLMHQAVPAFAAWFGVTPSVTPVLRAELESVLPRA